MRSGHLREAICLRVLERNSIASRIELNKAVRTFGSSAGGTTQRFSPRVPWCIQSKRWHLTHPTRSYSEEVQSTPESRKLPHGSVAGPKFVTNVLPKTSKSRSRLQNRAIYWQKHQRRFPDLPHRAFIALGSNTGDRVAWIELALQKLDKKSTVRVNNVSGLWESMPMYVLDQEKFINAVCVIDTSLKPIELLDFLQSIENDMGRIKVIDKGPRNIDLDILFYDTQIIDHERLQVPHPGLKERDFVLLPLSQLTKYLENHHSEYSHFLDEKQPSLPLEYWAELHNAQKERKARWEQWSIRSTYPVTALTSSMELLPRWKTHPTPIMAILNLTPDSFSDGGKHFSADETISDTDLLATVDAFVRDGANIIDIGGQSSRPFAEDISASAEISRTAPKIALIKNHLGPSSKVALSIDTYRSSVARAAVEAGADIINDVSSGLLDENMFSVMASTGKTVILGHMRGTPQTMTSLTDYGHDSEFLLPNIKSELDSRIDKALQAGVRPWRIILDPGFGFAKTEEQNLLLLKDLGYLISTKSNQKGTMFKEYGGTMPWMVGTSRKRFIGNVLGVKEPRERVWGTAATVAMAIQAGASSVRVHDVKEMAQVAKMVDAVRLAV